MIQYKKNYAVLMPSKAECFYLFYIKRKRTSFVMHCTICVFHQRNKLSLAKITVDYIMWIAWGWENFAFRIISSYEIIISSYEIIISSYEIIISALYIFNHKMKRLRRGIQVLNSLLTFSAFKIFHSASFGNSCQSLFKVQKYPFPLCSFVDWILWQRDIGLHNFLSYLFETLLN